MRSLGLASVVILSTACLHAQASPDGPRPGIQTTGVGTYEAEPDVALLMMGVSVERAKSASKARTEAATAMSGLVKKLRDRGIAARDIRTTAIRIEADYQFENRERKFVGYRADERLEIRVRDLDAVGTIIDEAMSAIGDRGRMDGLRFELLEPVKAQSKARASAVAAAQASAEELAKALGLKLGAAVEVVELSGASGPSAPGGPPQLRAMAESSTPVSPGTLSVQVAVRVRWAIAN